ncbi:unnamed protein product [Caenorhabditis sp. 36 PRJEB53466]|nr:unnamed protein product [Caenorhabditis sp. 36 PRJEB53466]
MSPPPRNHAVHQDQGQQQAQNQSPQTVPFSPVPPSSGPNTPIPLYPTGAAAIIPAPPTYELIPNRIFVGGFPTSTTESDLREHFEKFFPVKDVKMVKSLDGVSKGYGFITFESEDQAEAIRHLNPKQLEFRNRKLNLGPAIRKINANAFHPSYAIATTPSQIVPASPGAFGYAIPASPSPYGAFSLSATPQMFVYPPIANQDANRAPSDQQTSPQNSPSQQQQQVFFGGEHEPVRSYANAVTGTEKNDQSSDEKSGQQPLGTNNNALNTQYQGPQWNGNDQQSMDPNNNNGPYYNENYAHGGYPQPYPQYGYMNEKNGSMPTVPLQVYMNSNGIYTPAYPYMNQASQYPPLMPPYWPQHHPQMKSPYYNPGWMGPAGDMHYQHAQQQQQQQVQCYSGYYGGHQAYGNDENSFPRPLQPPRTGKKNRKPSESQEKKNKSPSKGFRGDKNSGSPTNSSPEAKSQKGRANLAISPLSTSLQSLAISSPTKQ